MTQEEKILFLKQEKKIEKLSLRITELEALLKDALDKLNKNSHNSSKPPSSDVFQKTKSLRTASGKKPGGQMGHKGTTLEMTKNPDIIVPHPVQQCSYCQALLTDVPEDHHEKRQVYDLPPIKMQVTEHRCVVKTCPYCRKVNKAVFPVTVEQPVQYGPQFKGLCVYLTNYQLLPYQRCAQLLADLLGHSPSPAALVNMNKSCSIGLQPFDQEMKKALVCCLLLYFDETGYMFCGKRNWLHVAATEQYTYYYVHEKRGKEAMNEMCILPLYKGVAMHDYWCSYLSYGCDHVLCHAHHLRELIFCEEQEKSRWAKAMKGLLLDVFDHVEEERQKGECALSAKDFGAYLYRYWEIMEQGGKEHPEPRRQENRRGRTTKSRTRNLLERFIEYGAEMLRFACDFSIPFTNNVAEQAVRMMKVKQKISGCFRSKEGAQNFALIRSYIDTIRKQGLSILQSLKELIEGKPWLPLVPAPA
jgi:transposase